MPCRIGHQITAAVAAGCAGLALAGTAGAVDLRDWSRKVATSERFVVLTQFGSDAVLDKETQLVWQKSPYPANSWAMAYTICLASGRGGRYGWRLPSHPELASLMQQGATSMPSVFAIPPGTYWTSTIHPDTDLAAMAVPAPGGSMTATSKASDLPFVCVRSPL